MSDTPQPTVGVEMKYNLHSNLRVGCIRSSRNKWTVWRAAVETPEDGAERRSSDWSSTPVCTDQSD